MKMACKGSPTLVIFCPACTLGETTVHPPLDVIIPLVSLSIFHSFSFDFPHQCSYHNSVIVFNVTEINSVFFLLSSALFSFPTFQDPCILLFFFLFPWHTTQSMQTNSEIIRTIFAAPRTERTVPNVWQKSLIVPLWKSNGNNRECETYQDISLLRHTRKIHTKVTEQRERHIVDPLLSPSQFGFGRRSSCTDVLLTMRQLSERRIEYDT